MFEGQTESKVWMLEKNDGWLVSQNDLRQEHLEKGMNVRLYI